MTQPSQPGHSDDEQGQSAAQKAMKQTAKTSSERNEPQGPNDGPVITGSRTPQRPGDAGVGQSDNEGSSPYADRSRKDEPQREG
jgi:hypothetical protein